mgnify:CR=1 FL=1
MVVDIMERVETERSIWDGFTDEDEPVVITYFNSRLRVEEGGFLLGSVSLPPDHPGRSHPGKTYDTLSNAGLKQALHLFEVPIYLPF